MTIRNKHTGKNRVFFFGPDGNLIKISDEIVMHEHAVIEARQFVKENKGYNATVMKLMFTTEEPTRFKWETVTDYLNNNKQQPAMSNPA